MSWSRRADNIRARDWSELLNHWAAFGAGFDTAQYVTNSLEVSVEGALEPSALVGNNLCIVEFDQRAPFVSELVFSQIKANHVLLCAVQRIGSGHATWGVTDAYHASLLLMRSIMAALGVFVCRAHERSILVDAFPWLGRLDDQKKFKKKYRRWINCAAIISCTAKTLEQAGFVRAISTSSQYINCAHKYLAGGTSSKHSQSS